MDVFKVKIDLKIEDMVGRAVSHTSFVFPWTNDPLTTSASQRLRKGAVCYADQGKTTAGILTYQSNLVILNSCVKIKKITFASLGEIRRRESTAAHSTTENVVLCAQAGPF